MKKIGLLLGLLSCFSCGNQPKEQTKQGLGCEGHKATAALKVYADVSADGTFKVLSFCKPQSARIKSYIYKRVEAYTIRRELMEEAYIKPGEQYLILRYQPGKIK